MTKTPENLRVSIDGARLDVVIDRPQARNALSIATLAEIAQVFGHHAGNETLKVAVLTGAGDKAFAAGGDIKELSQRRTKEDAAALFDLGSSAIEAVRRFPVPVVAALNGLALGGAAELAVACDRRIAAPHAAIGFVQAQLGLTTGFGGIASLQALVGPRRAQAMMLDAAILPAKQALEAGLVDAVAEEDEPLATLTDRFIEPILKRPAELVRDIKAIALAGEQAAGHEAIQKIERERFIRAWLSDEHWAAAEKVLSRKK